MSAVATTASFAAAPATAIPCNGWIVVLAGQGSLPASIGAGNAPVVTVLQDGQGGEAGHQIVLSLPTVPTPPVERKDTFYSAHSLPSPSGTQCVSEDTTAAAIQSSTGACDVQAVPLDHLMKRAVGDQASAHFNFMKYALWNLRSDIDNHLGFKTQGPRETKLMEALNSILDVHREVEVMDIDVAYVGFRNMELYRAKVLREIRRFRQMIVPALNKPEQEDLLNDFTQQVAEIEKVILKNRTDHEAFVQTLHLQREKEAMTPVAPKKVDVIKEALVEVLSEEVHTMLFDAISNSPSPRARSCHKAPDHHIDVVSTALTRLLEEEITTTSADVTLAPLNGEPTIVSNMEVTTTSIEEANITQKEDNISTSPAADADQHSFPGTNSSGNISMVRTTDAIQPPRRKHRGRRFRWLLTRLAKFRLFEAPPRRQRTTPKSSLQGGGVGSDTLTRPASLRRDTNPSQPLRQVIPDEPVSSPSECNEDTPKMGDSIPRDGSFPTLEAVTSTAPEAISEQQQAGALIISDGDADDGVSDFEMGSVGGTPRAAAIIPNSRREVLVPSGAPPLILGECSEVLSPDPNRPMLTNARRPGPSHIVTPPGPNNDTADADGKLRRYVQLNDLSAPPSPTPCANSDSALSPEPQGRVITHDALEPYVVVQEFPSTPVQLSIAAPPPPDTIRPDAEDAFSDGYSEFVLSFPLDGDTSSKPRPENEVAIQLRESPKLRQQEIASSMSPREKLRHQLAASPWKFGEVRRTLMEMLTDKKASDPPPMSPNSAGLLATQIINEAMASVTPERKPQHTEVRKASKDSRVDETPRRPNALSNPRSEGSWELSSGGYHSRVPPQDSQPDVKIEKFPDLPPVQDGSAPSQERRADQSIERTSGDSGDLGDTTADVPVSEPPERCTVKSPVCNCGAAARIKAGVHVSEPPKRCTVKSPVCNCGAAARITADVPAREPPKRCAVKSPVCNCGAAARNKAGKVSGARPKQPAVGRSMARQSQTGRTLPAEHKQRDRQAAKTSTDGPSFAAPAGRFSRALSRSGLVVSTIPFEVPSGNGTPPLSPAAAARERRLRMRPRSPSLVASTFPSEVPNRNGTPRVLPDSRVFSLDQSKVNAPPDSVPGPALEAGVQAESEAVVNSPQRTVKASTLSDGTQRKSSEDSPPTRQKTLPSFANPTRSHCLRRSAHKLPAAIPNNKCKMRK